jgi:hypothetical protein
MQSVGLDITPFFNQQPRETTARKMNIIPMGKNTKSPSSPQLKILSTSSMNNVISGDAVKSSLTNVITGGSGKSQSDYKDLYDIQTHDHSRLARFILSPMAIGMIRKEKVSTKTPDVESVQDVAKEVMLPARKYDLYVISNRKIVTKGEKGVFGLRVVFPEHLPSIRFGIGQHIFLQFMNVKEEKVVQRAYTPISMNNVGGIDLFIKSYKGEMTSHLETCTSIRMALPKNYHLPNPAMECSVTKNKMFKRLV